MNTATSVVLTAGIVSVAKWSKDQQISIKMIVGIGVLALFLSVIAEANAPLAQQMGLLVLVGAVFMYGPDVVKALKLA
jgi:hypothetical protein